ncbi:hypothetical protein BY458DRAFT_532948 [Sporodiniella umbellata]|nr:hypothetical protein BY458DRAFT_532948 [Sporodiniella umbellata]
MPRLDPFIVYTIRLVMENMTSEAGNTKKDHSATATAQILSLKSWPSIRFERPALKAGNFISLLYHADEQWLMSTQELKYLSEKEDIKTKKVEWQVHQQQRIYLDTLHLIQASASPGQHAKRYHEPIWFAAQVIHHQYHIRNLERFSEILKPFADQLYQALENVRLKMRRMLEKRPDVSFFSFLSRSKTEEKEELIKLDLDAFETSWCHFEDALYDCYVHTVFENHAHLFLTQNTAVFPKPVLHDVFNDPFTQLLPLTLERVLDHGLLDVQSIQCSEPLALIAIPRLAILAGVTWLSHFTQWRNQPTLPVWIRHRATSLQRIIEAVDSLSSSLLKAPLAYVERYQSLEQALVFGSPQQDAHIYLDICSIADSILVGPQAQAFSSVLGLLFRCYINESLDDHVFQAEQDAIPIEQTLFNLAI